MLSDTEYRAVEAFLYTEARLADEARYAEWEALWEDDAIYWVPAHPSGDTDSCRAATATARNRPRSCAG